MTFSIVAHDTFSGQFGVAVQSHWFSVASSVPWAEAGVGAVAVQSFADPSFGSRALELLRGGKSAHQVLDKLIPANSAADLIQLALVDSRGHAAAYTGKGCVEAAGQLEGSGVYVQANMVESPRVWVAMLEAFEQQSGDLAGRLVAALEAAEAEGGDIRGRQSTAVLVVEKASTGRPWIDRAVDLRVEESADPLPELRRLVELNRARDPMDRALELGLSGDAVSALEKLRAAEDATSGNADMDAERRFWLGVFLANAGQRELSVEVLRQVCATQVRWRKVLERFCSAGLVTDNQDIVKRVLQE